MGRGISHGSKGRFLGCCFFFFSFPSKPQESQYLECEGETIFIKSANNISLIIDVGLLFLLHIITSVLLSCHVLPHHSAPV